MWLAHLLRSVPVTLLYSWTNVPTPFSALSNKRVVKPFSLIDLWATGFTLILIVSPVAADLSAVVEEKERLDPDAFGPGGAYAQAFALFNCSMAAATLFGPVVAGSLVERFGWGVTTAAMGVFAFSGAVPAVSNLEEAASTIDVLKKRLLIVLSSSFIQEDGYSTQRIDTRRRIFNAEKGWQELG